MFSCCALFNAEDNDMDDMEHLKALEVSDEEHHDDNVDKRNRVSPFGFKRACKIALCSPKRRNAESVSTPSCSKPDSRGPSTYTTKLANTMIT